MGRPLIGLTTEEKRQRHLEQMRDYNKKHKERLKAYHKKRYNKKLNEISCDFCNITAKSNQNYQVHLTRKKHINNVQFYHNTICIVLTLLINLLIVEDLK